MGKACSFSGRMMKREDNQRSRRLLGFVALAAVTLCLTLPFLLANDPTEAILKSYVVRAAGQDSFTLSQPLRLQADPPVVLNSGTVSIGQPNGASPLGSRALAKLIASGRGILILRDAEISIGGAGLAPGTGTQATPSMAPLAKALADNNFRALLIEDSKIRFSGSVGRPIEFKKANIRLRPSAGNRLIANGQVEYLGRELEFESTISASASDRAAGQLPIRAAVRNKELFAVSFRGQFALGNGGRLIADTASLAVDDVPTMARWLGLAWPAELKLATFKAAGKMEWAGQILNFPNGRFKLDTNSAVGSLLLNMKGQRPLVDGTLAFKKLDVGKLVDLDGLHGTSLLASTVRKTASWLPPRVRGLLSELNLPILHQLNLDLRISADRTIAGNMSLGRTAAALSLHDGRVLVDLAELELAAGGHGNFQVTIDTSKPVAHCGLRGSLKQVQAKSLTDLLFPSPIITGAVDITLDLNGKWENPESFMRSLGGSVGVSMPTGAMVSADLPSLVKSVGLNEPAKRGWGDAKDGSTDLDNVTAHLDFEDGVARIREFRASNSSQEKLAVTGSFNIHRKHLDINLFPRTKQDSSEVPSVLRINGHWDSPQLSKIRFPDKAETPTFPIPTDSYPRSSPANGLPARRG